jgi:hypothetical protein
MRCAKAPTQAQRPTPKTVVAAFWLLAAAFWLLAEGEHVTARVRWITLAMLTVSLSYLFGSPNSNALP